MGDIFHILWPSYNIWTLKVRKSQKKIFFPFPPKTNEIFFWPCTSFIGQIFFKIEILSLFLCFMNLKYSRCQLLACPELLPPENGRFVHHQKCSNVFNSACGLQCNSGFELQNGSPVRICLPNGHWSGMQPRWLIMFFFTLRI